MTHLKRKFLTTLLILYDLMIIWFFCHITFNINVTDFPANFFASIFQVQYSIDDILLFLLIISLWYVIFSSFGNYTSHRLSSIKTIAQKITESAVISTILTYLIIMIVYPRKYNIANYIILCVGTTSAIVISRISLKFLLHWVRLKGRNLRYIVIVGTNHRAIKFAKTVVTSPELGYRLNGFVDDEWDGIEAFRESEFVLVSDLSLFTNYLRKQIVDEVYIFLPFQSKYSIICNIIAKCEEQGITVRFDTNIFNLRIARQNVEHIAEGNMITLKSSSITGMFYVIKCLIDVFVSSILLLFLSPIFLLIALAIKTTSQGPVFFVQKRIGLNKRQFSLIKFRTMVPNAEQMISDLEALNEVDGPAFKLKNDPRITAIGKFLRKTSLDELPQLLNVLKGDMSLVGPRPLPIRDYAGFSEDWHRRRFSVRPGVTCFWQVNGRNLIPFDQWMQLDMNYIDNWSLLLDFKILLKTIPAVIKGSGAS